MDNEIDQIAKQLEEEFFGPEFFEQDDFANKLLQCSDLETFQKIRAETKPEIVAALFDGANFTDPEAKAFTDTELFNIFNSMIAVAKPGADFL